MKSTVFDLPAVVNVADHFRPSVEECPRRDNVAFVAGDFFEDDLPPADIYSLGAILHDWDEERIEFLLRKIYNSLPSGNYILNNHGRFLSPVCRTTFVLITKLTEPNDCEAVL